MPQLQQLQSRFANSFDHTARRVEQPFYRQPGVHLRPLSGGFGVGRILATTCVDAGDNVGSGQAASSYGCLHIVARQNFDKRGLDEPDPVLIGLEVAECVVAFVVAVDPVDAIDALVVGVPAHLLEKAKPVATNQK